MRIDLSRLAFRTSVMVCAAALAGCIGGAVEEVWTPGVLSESLANKHWHVLYPPDSKFEPGVIMRLDDDGTPRWVGTLKDCNLGEALTIVPGSAPDINFKKTKDFSASILLSIDGVVELGPEAGLVKTVDLKISDTGADAIDLVKFQLALTSPANTIPTVCSNYFKAKDHYLVNEAFRISKGVYTLHQEDGVKLKVTDGILGRLFKLGGELGAKATTDGDIEITKPIYFAVRKAQETSGIWTSLTAASSIADIKTADSAIGKRNKTVNW